MNTFVPQKDMSFDEGDIASKSKNIPEINNAVSFLTKNHFIAGPNNPPGTITKWVS